MPFAAWYQTAKARLAHNNPQPNPQELRWLAASILGAPFHQLSAHNPQLSSGNLATLNAAFDRLVAGEPLAYILNSAEFYGLTLYVDDRVLIPRADSECLIDYARSIWGHDARLRIADMGTGSGALICAAATHFPHSACVAVDSSMPALTVAKRNARTLGLNIACLHGDWFGAFADHAELSMPKAEGAPAADKHTHNARNPDGADAGFDAGCDLGFDIILANPPYIAEDDAHLTALTHEPRAALVAKSEGLADAFTIADTAHKYLRPGGALILEHGHTQGAAIRARLALRGYKNIKTHQDLAGRDRFTVAYRAWLPTQA